VRLHLVRHPPVHLADGVCDRVCYGSSDVPAAFDASLLARLCDALPRGVPLFSSPLKRCADLAAALAPLQDCAAPIHDVRLAEMHFGDWEMRAWNDIPRSEVDAWTADLIRYRPGGGENVLEVAWRVRAFRDEVIQLDASDVIVICHAGTMRLLLAGEYGAGLEDTALRASQHAHQIGHGEVIVLECKSNAS
jgi:alpha-ribazole phosphatase